MTTEEFLANPTAALEAAQGGCVELTEDGKVVAFISVPRKCPDCEGDGFDYTGGDWRCPTCEGRGVVP